MVKEICNSYWANAFLSHMPIVANATNSRPDLGIVSEIQKNYVMFCDNQDSKMTSNERY